MIDATDNSYHSAQSLEPSCKPDGPVTNQLTGCSKRPDFSPAPTLARRDAPHPNQGRSERRGEEVLTALCVAVRPLNGSWRTENALQCFRASKRGENAADGLFQQPLGLFDLDDRLTLIGSTIQTGVMRQLDFVALRTDGHARRSDAQFLCPALVASLS